MWIEPAGAMGFFQAIGRMLGFQPPLVVTEPAPFHLSPAARAHAARHGITLAVDLVPAEGGFTPRFTELPQAGSAVVASSADALRLRGLVADFDEAWRLRVEVRIDVHDTPNPEARAFLADRALARGRPRLFTTAEHAPPLARRVLAIPGAVSVLLRENLVLVERAPWARVDHVDREVEAAIREHLLLCGGTFEGDAHTPTSAPDDLKAAVQHVIDERIAPRIHHDGGDIELVDVSADGVVVVALSGACQSCAAVSITLKSGVERTLKDEFPGRITRVEAV